MAVHVEDHPLEYFDFEGVIPKGQYGAGDVIVWDWGTFMPEAETPDPGKAIDDGELKFELHGEKLQRPLHARPDEPPARLRPDDGLRGRLGAVAADQEARRARVGRLGCRGPPQSVKTGRTNDEVKEQSRGALDERHARGDRRDRPRRRRRGAAPGLHRADARDARDAAVQRPRLAVRDQVGRLPAPGDRQRRPSSGPTRAGASTARRTSPDSCRRRRWIAAGPGDRRRRGGRARRGRRARLRAAPGGDQRPPDRRAEPAADPDGPRPHLAYQAFDLLYLDGRSLLRSRSRTASGCSGACSGRRTGSASRRTSRPTGSRSTRPRAELGLEGIVAKLRRSPYEPGRRSTPGSRSRSAPSRSSSSAAGRPARATPRTSARSPSACTRATSSGSRARSARGSPGGRARSSAGASQTLETDDRAVRPGPGATRASSARVTWVKPELVIRAELGGWTREGYVRQTAFKGIDEGHDPRP